MALRQLVLRKKIDELNKQLVILREKDAEFTARAAALTTREAELEAALEEITEETPEEDRATFDENMTAFEADQKALEDDKATNEADKAKLQDEIQKLQAELEEIEERTKTPPKTPPSDPEKRKGEKPMNTRVKFFESIEQRDAFFARGEVRDFIEEVRAIKTRGVTNGSLTIPDVMLDILRDNMERYSKLIGHVNVKRVNGTARQNIVGAPPEGVWMEATGALNELDMSFNQIEVDGFMVGGIIWVHNTLLEDSDIALGSEIMDQLGQAIGKGIDRAILYGTGTKMPVGIATRLAQTSAPSDWGTYAPAWTDLHTSNVKKLNIDGTTGAAFYASLIDALGAAKPNYSDGRAFWVMNRKTHIKLMTKALAFDAAAALVAGVNNQMPIIGGDIVELEMPGDNEVIGGYGAAYLLAERAGSRIESSEHARFSEMLTGFRGYARYDGMPVFGEAFVIVSFDNSDAVTSSTFPVDYANTEIGTLAVTSAASATTSGDTVVTVAGTESSGTTLAYKVAGKAIDIKNGTKPVGFTAWDGSDEITAATGTIITVVELNDEGRAIKVGSAQVVAKA
jgi:HK97 family phage major capsid protein